jgi:hypothetical protein
MSPRFATALVATALALLAGPAAPVGAAPNSPLASVPRLSFPLPPWAPPQLRALVPARPAPRRSRHPFEPSFEFKAPHGYTITVAGSENRVALIVGRKHSLTATEYVTHGTVTRRRIEASFGAFGKLSMRFGPARGRRGRPHAVCRAHRQVVTRHGVFRGTLSFRGEGDYLSFDVHRVRGEITSLGSRCRGSHGIFEILTRSNRPRKPREHGPEPRLFFAGWRHAVDAAGFIALDLFGEPFFLAESEHTEGRLAIVRFAAAIGRHRSFTLNDALTQAKLSPRRPFQGAGVYRAAPDGTKTWEGSLSVNFPGAPHFSLTGPPFEPELAAGFPGF